jgi:hypothetical protein
VSTGAVGAGFEWMSLADAAYRDKLQTTIETTNFSATCAILSLVKFACAIGYALGRQMILWNL